MQNNTTQPVYILLSTFNGSKYLHQQIDSFLNQTNQKWHLLIRDDGSKDETINIIDKYTSLYPNKIKLASDSFGNLGTAKSFAKLLEYESGEYFMFSDQDDIWLPNKIELTTNAMKTAEEMYPNMPLLIHTDLRVVDADLKVIAESMWNYQSIHPERDADLRRLCVRNIITGCTVMINQKAKQIVLPFPAETRIHDWWIALNVAKYGKLIHIAVPTVLYRQHGANIIGVKKSLKKDILSLPQKFIRAKRFLLSDYKMVKKIMPNIGLAQWLLKNIVSSIERRFNHYYLN
jgi:glycosyltransferase involved in cell wall biosynthesis